MYLCYSYIHGSDHAIEMSLYRMEGNVGELTRFEHLAKESLAN